ncbi:MAG: S46 family peptidase, partial [Planctomycetota bacterium]
RRGRSFYPDANSTLRLSVATVKGYEPRDGVVHVPFTTVDGMIAKHTGEGEFDVPLPIRQAVQGMPSNGATTVNFLADGDTTGGNSGSAVVDGKGRLVGLNFDRVFENVSGDFGWNADRSRNISVDMQYVLWLMRDIWPSPRLLAEMGVDG